MPECNEKCQFHKNNNWHYIVSKNNDFIFFRPHWCETLKSDSIQVKKDDVIKLIINKNAASWIYNNKLIYQLKSNLLHKNYHITMSADGDVGKLLFETV